jgi:phage anti-repressor protein/phage antirepressor YoqD-like protein
MNSSTPRQSSLTIVDEIGEPFSVDARELQRLLGHGRDFTNWIKYMIERLGLSEGADFSPFLAKSTGGRPATEYRLTQSAAKRIQIAARGEVGDAARDGAVKLHDHVESIQAPSDDEIILRAQQILQTRVAALTSRVAELEPRAEIADRLTAAEGDMSLSDAARRLGFGPRWFIARLACEGVIHGHVRMRRPRADLLKAGFFVVRSVQIGTWPDGSPRFEGQTMVTYAGLSWMAGKYQTGKALAARAGVRP